MNRAPIVWIYQREIPGFVSLINVRHARRSQFEQSLSKRIDCAESRNLFRDWEKSRQKLVLWSRIQNFRDKIARRGEPLFVRLDPTRVQLRFVQRFRHVSLNALDVFSADVL